MSSIALQFFFFFTIPSSFYSSFTVFCVLPSAADMDCGPYGLPGVFRRQWMPVHRGSDGNNVGTSAICVCNSHTRGHTDNTKTTRVLTSQLLAFQRGWRFPWTAGLSEINLFCDFVAYAQERFAFSANFLLFPFLSLSANLEKRPTKIFHPSHAQFFDPRTRRVETILRGHKRASERCRT